MMMKGNTTLSSCSAIYTMAPVCVASFLFHHCNNSRNFHIHDSLILSVFNFSIYATLRSGTMMGGFTNFMKAILIEARKQPNTTLAKLNFTIVRALLLQHARDVFTFQFPGIWLNSSTIGHF
jgi:hypothetical protein